MNFETEKITQSEAIIIAVCTAESWLSGTDIIKIKFIFNCNNYYLDNQCVLCSKQLFSDVKLI